MAAFRQDSTVDPDDINSSDAEYDLAPAPQSKRFENAGAQGVSAILENPTELRLQTKKDWKQLNANGPIAGAKGTLYISAQAKNQWETFFTKSLNRSIETVPTGEDVVRFLLASPNLIHGLHRPSNDSNTAQSNSNNASKPFGWGTLQSRLKYILKAIHYRHNREFQLSSKDKQLIQDAFETLRQNGSITTEPTRKKQWVTAKIVSSLTRALFVNAIKKGHRNWSIVIQKALGLALQSALSCRAGDGPARSNYYEDHEYLSFQHILLKITLPEDSDLSSDNAMPILDRIMLHAEITLKYTKGKKRDLFTNQVIYLSSLEDSYLNVVDPLKLLLVHALRQSAILGAKTIDDAVQLAVARSDNLVQWKYPNRPVLCKLVRFSCSRFNYDAPVGVANLLSTLNEAAKLAGITERLVTHDVRRGAAEDAAALPLQQNLDNAQRALGHNHFARSMGVTSMYADGPNSRSTFGERLALDSTKTQFGLNIRKGYSKDGQATTSQEPDSLLQPRERLPLQSWTTSEINANQPRTLLEEHPEHLETTRKRKYTDDSEPDEDYDEPGEDPDQPGENDVAGWRAMIDPALLALSGLQSPETNDESYAPQLENNSNEALLERFSLAQDMESLDETSTTTRSNLRVTRADLPIVPTVAEKRIENLDSPNSVFLPFLCSINEYRENRSDRDHLRGGSREEPSVYEHHCEFENLGCTYSSYRQRHVTTHMDTCKFKKLINDEANFFSLECTETPECTFVARRKTLYDATKTLKKHKSDKHNVGPQTKRCSKGGYPECESVPISNERQHRDDHAGIVPQRCPIPGCNLKLLFSNRLRLTNHLTAKHKDVPVKERKEMADAAPTQVVFRTPV